MSECPKRKLGDPAFPRGPTTIEDPEAKIQRPSGWGSRPFRTPGFTQATASGSICPEDMLLCRKAPGPCSKPSAEQAAWNACPGRSHEKLESLHGIVCRLPLGPV